MTHTTDEGTVGMPANYEKRRASHIKVQRGHSQLRGGAGALAEVSSAQSKGQDVRRPSTLGPPGLWGGGASSWASLWYCFAFQHSYV